MALLNLVNLATLNAITSAYNSVPTTGAVVLSAVPSAHVYKLNTVTAINKTNTAATISLVIYRNTSTYTTLAYQMSVPGTASLNIVSKDTPIYLMDTQSDVLSAIASTSNAIDLIVSYDDIY